jgi:dienelactone hydrolase
MRRNDAHADPLSRRQELLNLLGDLPDRTHPVTASTLWTERRETYQLEKLVLDLNQIEPAPAYFARPLDRCENLPVILYNHAHWGEYQLGKEEFLAGRNEPNSPNSLQAPPYAEQLTRLGCAALCVDMWAFGERATRDEEGLFKEMLWRGRVLWGMRVYDSLRAIDYLVSRPEVDGSRLGTIGMSMGSTMAWWVAALDERVKVCIDLCCLTDFEALIESDQLESQGLFYFVPGLLKHFQAHEINALIAPRPHLSLAGDQDTSTPSRGLDRMDAELKRVYATVGAPEAWKLLRYDCGHIELPEMRREIISFLGKWL